MPDFYRKRKPVDYLAGVVTDFRILLKLVGKSVSINTKVDSPSRTFIVDLRIKINCNLIKGISFYRFLNLELSVDSNRKISDIP